MLFIVLISAGTIISTQTANAESFLFQFPPGFPLGFVSSIGIDSSGNLYVTHPHKVTKFNQDGALLLEFGSRCSFLNSNQGCVDPDGAGPLELGDGQFDGPRGISIDSEGNIYVVGLSNQRVQKFDSTGTFLLKFGSLGSGDGQFNFPAGTAIDSSDNVYVTDFLNDRVQKFNSEGVFLSKFGSEGSGDGQFDAPGGIAIDSSDNIYVVDQLNHRIQKFNSTGDFQLKYGSHCEISSGTDCVDPDDAGPLELGDGQFNFPNSVGVDSADNVYVTAASNQRVQKFDSAGEFLLKFGSMGSCDGQFNAPGGITIDPFGNIFVADAGNKCVQKFNSTGDFQTKFESPVPTDDGNFDQPLGIAHDSSDNIYVADDKNNRVQKFDSVGNFLLNFGSFGSGDGQFDRPIDIAVNSADNVYVTDFNNHRVQKFDSSGNFQGWMGKCTGGSNCVVNLRSNGFMCTAATCTGLGLGFLPGQFQNPSSITIDSLDNIFVGDSSNHRIQKFSLAGNFQLEFGTSCFILVNDPNCVDPDGGGPLELGDGQFFGGPDLAIDSFDNIYVADEVNNRIQKFNNTGGFLSKFGAFGGNGTDGSGDGEFDQPKGIALDSADNIYVAEVINDRVQKFNSTHGFISKFGSGQFNNPSALTVISTDNIYVVDSGNNRVQVWGEIVDPDIDGDGVANESDNCPSVSNAGQEDADGDGIKWWTRRR
jgi:DNA-binding beta-propeller fold protein YncE